VDCGLISENFRGLFENKFERGEWTAGCISRKFEDFYVNLSKNARSEPLARPIGRSGAAGDVARSQARELARNRRVRLGVFF